MNPVSPVTTNIGEQMLSARMTEEAQDIQEMEAGIDRPVYQLGMVETMNCVNESVCMLNGECSNHCIQMQIKEMMDTMVAGTLSLKKEKKKVNSKEI